MTKAALVWLALVIAGLVGWVGGILAYVNWFSETGRTGGDVVMAAMWSSALLGLVALFGFGLSIRRGPRA